MLGRGRSVGTRSPKTQAVSWGPARAELGQRTRRGKTRGPAHATPRPAPTASASASLWKRRPLRRRGDHDGGGGAGGLGRLRLQISASENLRVSEHAGEHQPAPPVVRGRGRGGEPPGLGGRGGPIPSGTPKAGEARGGGPGGGTGRRALGGAGPQLTVPSCAPGPCWAESRPRRSGLTRCSGPIGRMTSCWWVWGPESFGVSTDFKSPRFGQRLL